MRAKPKLLGRKIYSYGTVSSTNTLAYHLAEGSEDEGTVVVAERQTLGRGKVGRKWHSPRGKGILISIILRPRVSPEILPKLTQVACLAVGRAIHEFTGLRPTFRWPNDLLLNRRKVSGILCEVSTRARSVNFLVMGIGINVNTERKDLVRGATSLKCELGRSLRRPRLFRDILRTLEEEYLLFRAKYEA